MNKYDYYTPSELAECLMQLIPTTSAQITSIADICCGTWNLLSAAHSRFPNASITGVDINKNVEHNCITNATFLAQDGRDFANEMTKKGIHFDLILSNPPFGPLSASQKKYEGNTCIQSFKRYESEMLFANYLLLKNNGFLLIILPVTYAKGSQYKKHRIWIAQNFDILNIVSLPQNTFGTKLLHTVALVLRKTQKPTETTTQLQNAEYCEEGWKLTTMNQLARNKVSSGDWFTTQNMDPPKQGIFRGSISSQYFSESGVPILHCSSNIINDIWEPSVRMCSGFSLSKEKYAESGDIVINRIGKCAAAWKVYKGSRCLVSDCIIVIKQPDDSILNIFSTHSQGCILQIPRLGVSTPYISSSDIINLLSCSQA